MAAVPVIGLVIGMSPGGAFGSSGAVPTCFGQRATIVGSAAGDTLIGSRHRDVIVGLGGDDHISGRGGDDLICGGAGDDYIRGGGGNDRIRGGGGDDHIRGGAGNDQLRGGPGQDRCVSPAPPAATKCENTARASLSSDHRQANARSEQPAISADGRYVAFVSPANNLVPGVNGELHVFVRDRRTGSTTLASVTDGGEQPNGASELPSISTDGRFVAFVSFADNLVPGDSNDSPDEFVRDRQTGTTTRVSVASDGSQAINSGSASYLNAMSGDGRFVAFDSAATNLVVGDTNGSPDVFVHDMLTGATSRVSVAGDGSQATANSTTFGGEFSGNGRSVAFMSDAANLVPGDTNQAIDVFVHDLVTGATTRVSVSGRGHQSNSMSLWPTLSADGRYVAFESLASNLVRGDTNGGWDVFVHDRLTGATRRISGAAGTGLQPQLARFGPVISADGRYVCFESDAHKLVPGDTNPRTDVFEYDMRTLVTTRVSVARDGSRADGRSRTPSVSGDGRIVAFQSTADNLVPEDTNGDTDVFVRLVR